MVRWNVSAVIEELIPSWNHSIGKHAMLQVFHMFLPLVNEVKHSQCIGGQVEECTQKEITMPIAISWCCMAGKF